MSGDSMLSFLFGSFRFRERTDTVRAAAFVCPSCRECLENGALCRATGVFSVPIRASRGETSCRWQSQTLGEDPLRIVVMVMMCSALIPVRPCQLFPHLPLGLRFCVAPPPTLHHHSPAPHRGAAFLRDLVWRGFSQ